MIQELSNKVWSNPAFQEARSAIERAWLLHELKLNGEMRSDETIAIKAMNAATILACSENNEQRATAYKLATCLYDLFPNSAFPFDEALRVVLTRLGNFPATATKNDVSVSQAFLPWLLASEELFQAEERTVSINSTPFVLTDFQHALWNDLYRKYSIAFSAPTSAGKSFILESYLAAASTASNASVVYIVPTRALISQVASDLEHALSGHPNAPVVITVPPERDRPLKGNTVYVMTQERVQLSLLAHPDFKPEIIVVDEAQSIADGSRGILLQSVVEELIGRTTNAQVLFASPTIRNLEVFGKLFGLPNIVERISREPTVAQNFIIIEVRSSKGAAKIKTAPAPNRPSVELAAVEVRETLASRVDRLVHIPAFLGTGQANLVYTNIPDEAEKVALQLADKFFDRVTTEAQENLASLAQEAVHSEYVLAQCVRKGVGFHYGNIPTILRLAIEDAFKQGHLDYLVCTSTLLQGVNLPAKNIFMYAPKKGRKTKMEAPDFWNLSGRAGRLLREFQATFFSSITTIGIRSYCPGRETLWWNQLFEPPF